MNPCSLVDLQELNERGFAIIRNAIGPSLLELARGHADWIVKNESGLNPQKIDSHKLVLDPFFHFLVCHPEVTNLAIPVLGPNLAHFFSRYYLKPAMGDGIPWHQDGAYYPLDPPNFVTIWLALDDANEENGCLSILPHLPESFLPIIERKSDKSIINHYIDDQFIGKHKEIHVNVGAGDAVLLHPRAVHRSGHNRTCSPRRAISIRYISVATRILWHEFYDCDWDCVFLAAGDPVGSPNTFARIPSYKVGEHMAFPCADNYK